MLKPAPEAKVMRLLRLFVAQAAIVMLLVLSSTGCIVVGGYSSDSGFWIWPGTIVLLVIGLALFLLMRRRRG